MRKGTEKFFFLRSLAFCILLSFSLNLWAETAETEKTPRYVALMLGNTCFPEMELALTPEEHARGLMHRKSLSEQGGMLFVFPDEAPRSFWMRETEIPLDILFLDAEGKILSIHTMMPPKPRRPEESLDSYLMKLPRYESGRPAKYAMEIHAGLAESLGLEPGQRIVIPPLPVSSSVKTKRPVPRG